jgi:hypothetical protein
MDALAYFGSWGGLQFGGYPLPSSRLGDHSLAECQYFLGYLVGKLLA